MKFEMYPTCVTPYLEDGNIDYESLEKLIAYFARMGCDGLFAVCQSSEMFFLSDEEKLELAKKSLELCRKYGMKCVVSGHTQDKQEDQIRYLKELEKLHPDAIILVSNRLAAEDEDDEIAVKNLKIICGALDQNTKLGIYECPYPYKRLLTEKMIRTMAEDDRFEFIKDTCCMADEIAKRIKWMEGSRLKLYNANSATLLESVEAGAAGYSGVQLNLSPEIFYLLKKAYLEKCMEKVAVIGSYLSASAPIEYQNYPANAKYTLVKKGIFKTYLSRNGKPPMTESQKKEMDCFMELNRTMYFQFSEHENPQLIFGMDTAFPECHASTVLPLDDGKILVTYFAGAHERADDVGIWLSVCENNVWQAPKCIAKVCREPHWNPVIFKSRDKIRVVFKVGKQVTGWRSYSMYSEDEGKTWSEPKYLAGNPAAPGPVRNKPLVLSDGRILAPNSNETDVWSPQVDVSLDDGETFEKLADIPVNRTDADKATYMKGKGAIQPTLWESAPGQVHALLRTTAGKIFRSDSSDGGKTWCTAYPVNLPNNNSGIDLVQKDHVLYLVMNPVQKGRTPIVLLRSFDNGENFECFRVLADKLFDEKHQNLAEFSYPAIVEKNNELFITHTYDRKSIAFYRIRL